MNKLPQGGPTPILLYATYSGWGIPLQHFSGLTGPAKEVNVINNTDIINDIYQLNI